MKYQVLFSLKNNEKVFKMLSTAVVIGALRLKWTKFIYGSNINTSMTMDYRHAH